ncbi:beta-N-acetylglucosaminidase domain-containing protein [Peterkaempfera bronchialis]|uniref:beta-N-acetylglucosaminidase domain-containing protein n=1 Tax=Peterkaempfera bronchialis TaxID=2126346 RepID=UPI001E383244|nr:beta-N-acetylglucosaminidase domain-containing protein [Peterkaempfera bronchialis]
MPTRLSVPAVAGLQLRRHLERSAALRDALYHPAALAARRTTARTARRLAPLTADRLIADLKGTEPLLERVREERAAADRTGQQQPSPRPGGRRAALRATAALSAAAVVGGLVAGAQPAAAAGRDGGGTSAVAVEGQEQARSTVAVPEVFPRPQDQQAAGRAVTVPRRVAVVAAPQADPGALDVVREVLRGSGAEEVSVARQAPAPTAGSLLVLVGGIAEGADGQTDRVLRELAMAAGRADTSAPSPSGLPAGGYVLSAGQLAASGGGAYGAVVLAGVDGEGTFNAAQTLRQLVTAVPAGQGQTAEAGRGLPGVTVRDWPSTRVRGTVEGFYGRPWTAEQRLSEIDFLGATKQNSYLYAPGDDPYRLSQWREPYPAARQTELRTLTERAARNHVVPGYALSPGQSLCYTSENDVRALVGKLESLWGLGFRAFQLQFQDVSYEEWHCRADRNAYGTGPEAAARAQGELVTKVLERFAAGHAGQGLAPLSVMPTEYHQRGATPYREALAKALPPAAQVAWTGVGVVPERITADQLRDTEAVLAHPLVTMDNYPVNDWSEDRLYLGPYTGREAGVATGSAALLVNAMEQPVASRIALFTAADYAWNPAGYRPQDSWRGALRALAGGSGAADEALRTLAGNSSSSPLATQESAYLLPLLQRFWSAVEPTVMPSAKEQPGPGKSGHGKPGQGKPVQRKKPADVDAERLAEAADALRDAFTAMEQAPEALRPVAAGALADEAGPWLEQLARYGKAGRSAVDMLLAQRSGDGAAAWRARLELRGLTAEIAGGSATVGAGVLDPFLKRVLKTADSWSGVSGSAARATTTMGPEPGHGAAMMTDDDPRTFFWSDAPPQRDDSVGVDLGADRPVGRVVVQMGSQDPAGDASGDSPDDVPVGGGSTAAPSGAGEDVDDGYLHQAVLEYSTGNGGWHRITEVSGTRTVSAALPAGTVARYVRLRATEAQETTVAVREFTVTAPGAEQPTVSGGPPAAPGSSVAAVVDGDADTAYRAASAPGADDRQLVVDLGATRPLDRVSVLTDPAVNTEAVVEARKPDGGWVRLGAVRPGYTELAGHGRQVDALRLTWAYGGEAPVVNEIVPWYADSPVARLEVSRSTLDVVAGAPQPATASATLEATLAGAAAGQFTVRLPKDAKGLTASAPAAVTVPRGGRLAVPLAVSAAAGTPSGVYRVPVSFTSGGRTVDEVLQVRVVPPVSGPDLARTATATSSGDRDDHPAAAAVDGDPETRWASSGGDDSWFQLELAEPARLGSVILHWQSDAVLSWQNAYAVAYRVETSPDGVSWTAAATVEDGHGGTETVRLDAPGTRFVRVQGVLAANRFGYSLSSVEAYAVDRPVGGGTPLASATPPAPPVGPDLADGAAAPPFTSATPFASASPFAAVPPDAVDAPDAVAPAPETTDLP